MKVLKKKLNLKLQKKYKLFFYRNLIFLISSENLTKFEKNLFYLKVFNCLSTIDLDSLLKNVYVIIPEGYIYKNHVKK